MYNSYRSPYGYSNYGSYGSSYGSSYGGYYNNRSRYGYRSFDYSPYYNNYYYGSGRNRPYYWERDRNISRSWRSRVRRDDRRSRSRSRREDTPSPPPAPPKPEPPEEELLKTLHVKEVDLHVEANTKKHRTDEYFDCSTKVPAELVVRRGDSIKLTITFDRSYNKEKDDLRLCFSIGQKATPSRGTKAQFDVDESGNKKFKPEEWGATLQGKTGNDVTILVHIPCNCIIGEWNFSVITLDSKEKAFEYQHNEDVTILFNPWCKEDGVYMENQSELNEYILNENGCVFRGNSYQMGAKEWNFGQFEKDILDICLHLIRTGFKGGVSKSMSDPVRVSRMIAKLVNLAGDDIDRDAGVLVGKWGGSYEDGAEPWTWVGSLKILRQWRKSGPVKYGQCWVFSCVTTTVCRALGIPCRTVTNFSSAHDTDGSNCIEKYFDDEDNELEHKNSDSVWNFHVWNEVWMARPDLKDLKTGFEFLRKPGWQVIDATPQEMSDGVYTCGPCPVLAVYKGYCSVDYDTSFVFAEVNSDEVHWTLLPGGEFKVKDVFKRKVGQRISTKKPDGLPYKLPSYGAGGMRFDRNAYDLSRHEDLTLKYKPKEGSKEERDTVAHALSKVGHRLPGDYMKEAGYNRHSVEFHLLHDNSLMIGSDLKIQLTAKNNGKENAKLIKAKIVVAAKEYTGGAGKAFFEQMLNVDDAMMNPGEETTFTILLKHEDYLPNVVSQAHFVISASASYRKTGDSELYKVRKEHNYRFRRPDLEVTCPSSAKKGEKVKFEVSFKNPLDLALTKCDISMESSGFENIDDEKQNDVPANGEYKKTFVLEAERVKEHAAVTFSFDCAQLKDISGGNSIAITK